ncbi:Chaperone protein TorD [bioreactor metagenome]|uniref:Chaperone protein TorD n=1 Tax=bioreactor metagenome TaxID=1076179 RepID=A0A644UB95_9ZZZZ|nr:molecular chaperone TorD family protein [Desulfitobacterium hafniense]MEA5025599.1 molecular chaperone TorD family protein [Desulfitobacterium hafniense]
MEKTTEREIQRAISTSDLYQILAMSLHLPNTEIAQGLLAGSMAEDIIAIFQELGFSDEATKKIETVLLAIQNSQSLTEELLSDLRQEYTRLFTHPKKPEIEIYETLFLYNPEESRIKPALFISPAAMHAEHCYEKAGLVPSKEVNEPGDHMATEMEFMMFLHLEKAKALQADNQEELARREAEIQEFETLHLQKWAHSFFEKMASISHSDFYRALGAIGSILMVDRLSI